MSQQNIDFGSFPNDPDADAIRSAFQKTQENFTELYNLQKFTGVLTVNLTKQAGITVNPTSGNVLISADFSRLNVTTTSLEVGLSPNSLGYQTSVNNAIQTLYLDLRDDTYVSNSFTVGDPFTSPNVVIANGNVVATGILKSSGANLGDLSNVKILGGATGFVIATDGTGNLSWLDVVGATGAAGDKYSTTSSNTLSIVTGTQSFTVGTGLSYSTGQGVIIANTVSRLMTGSVASYNSGTGAMVVSVTSTTGSGSYSFWSVNLAGAVGTAGATGATGLSGIVEGPTAPGVTTVLWYDTSSTAIEGVGATGATGPIGGLTTQVIFNDAGVANGSTGLVYDKTTSKLTAGNITVVGFNISSIQTAISAAGATQGAATLLTKDINVVSTVTVGQGVKLPVAVAGMILIINNTSLNTLNVYPNNGAQINAAGTNTAVTHASGLSRIYYAVSTTQWYTI